MHVQEKIYDFLKKQLYDTDRPDGPVVKLQLRHIHTGNSTKDGEVCSTRIPHNEYRDEDTGHSTFACPLDDAEIRDLAFDFQSQAHEDAEGLGGRQRYKLFVYRKFETHPTIRLTFRMQAENVEEDVSGISENPDMSGITSQLMRHNEVIMRTGTMGANQTIALQCRTIARLNEQVEMLLAERRKNIELYEQLQSQQHERDMEMQEAKQSAEHKNELFSQVRLLLPTVVNKVAGRKILPETISSNEALMEELLMNFDEDQYKALEVVLKPAQRLALASIWEKILDKREHEKAEQKKLKAVND